MFDIEQQLSMASYQKKIINKLINSDIVMKYAISIITIHDEIIITMPTEVKADFIKEFDELMKVTGE